MHHRSLAARRRLPAQALLSAALLGLALAGCAEPRPAWAGTPRELVVYTYDSFTSKWGPGPEIQQRFEAGCGCRLRWVAAEDAAALLTRLRLEGSDTKADVVLGLDTSLLQEAQATGLFDRHGVIIPGHVQMPRRIAHDDTFVPYDYGWFAFMHDTQKLATPPASLAEFLDAPQWEKSLLVQDPRTSTPGLGLLLWIKAIYGPEAPKALEKLRRKTLTVTKGWSGAYGLFVKGEAPLVHSYTTSEAYHRVAEKSGRYRALLFPEGHYLQIEVAALLRASREKGLARSFLAFLLDAPAQKAVATRNWMYPVLDPALLGGLPAPFRELARPARTLFLEPEEVARHRKGWIEEWLTFFR